MKYTTLNEIRKHNPCSDGWEKLLNNLGKTKADDDKLSFKTILESNGIDDAVWCLSVLDYKEYCLFSAEVAESVLHIFEKEVSDDKRPHEAIAAVRAFYNGEISKSELYAARAAAWDAARATSAAAWAAWDAARAAAVDAAWATVDAAWAATRADRAAARDAARAAKWEEIEKLFIKHFC